MQTKQSDIQDVLRTTYHKTPARLAATLAFLTLLALPAGAQTVLNPSFEEKTPVDGDFIGPAVTNWTDENSGGGPSTGGGTFNLDEVHLTGAGGSGTATGGHGTNVFTTYTENAPSRRLLAALVTTTSLGLLKTTKSMIS